MKPMKRSEFLKNSAVMASGVMVAPSFVRNLITDSPNERVNVASAGCRYHNFREVLFVVSNFLQEENKTVMPKNKNKNVNGFNLLGFIIYCFIARLITKQR